MKLKSIITLCLILLSNWQLTKANAAQTNQPNQINFTKTMPTEGNLILGVFQDGVLGPQAQAMDQDSNGALSHAIKAADFEAKIKTTHLITAPMGSGFDQILLVGLGQQDKSKTNLQWQEIGGHAVQQAVKAFKTVPMIIMDISELDNSIEINANVAYGAKLGSYYFDKYYTNEKRHKYQQRLTFVTNQTDQTSQYYTQELNSVADGIWFTRNSANEPANV